MTRFWAPVVLFSLLLAGPLFSQTNRGQALPDPLTASGSHRSNLSLASHQPNDPDQCNFDTDDFETTCCGEEWDDERCVGADSWASCTTGYGYCGQCKESLSHGYGECVNARLRPPTSASRSSSSSSDLDGLALVVVVYLPDKCSGTERYAIIEIGEQGYAESSIRRNKGVSRL